MHLGNPAPFCVPPEVNIPLRGGNRRSATSGFPAGKDRAELVEAREELLDLICHRLRWHERAACRGQGVEQWFPARGADVRPRVALCASCPMRCECLAAASSDACGIWVGMLERGRKMARRGAA
ncbi:MAG: WhiB family transcriptional regulator [Acidimicrobiia bacterium]|nr:WhiB family transcriptional regulator [Acidimicrobiia bacterium]